jgi:superfamily I DNA/RNA helicase
VEPTNNQHAILNLPLDEKIFLAGPASCGKTTIGVSRLQSLLSSGIPADSILVLTPQRTLQLPYETILRGPETGPGGMVTLATVGGLARRMCDLFWPLVAEAAGFAHPDQPPIFLTLETAQYYMARIVRPLLEEGFFESVTIDRNRLYSQIIDNLNKAASVGFPYTEIGPRLDMAWYGELAQRRIYANAQECAARFRQYCLDHNLLDFSLQLDIFWNILWHTPQCHDYLTRQYRHLIYDNVEEDIPVAHDLLCEWLPDLVTAFIIFDEDAGYRRFLGADPESALRLKDLCNIHAELNESFVVSPEIEGLSSAFAAKLLPSSFSPLTDESKKGEGRRNALNALALPSPEIPTRFYPQMLDWVADEIQRLTTEENIAPSEIVVLAPYLSDALRFSLSNRLEERGVPWRSHRPSRSLRDEPATHCLLTLSELAHPTWNIHPTKFDVAYALLYAIEGMDLVRAQLLTDIIYRVRDFRLSTFDEIRTEVQERITFVFGQRYETLRQWIEAYRQQSVPDPLDHFLRRLFGEVLSQKGFGFHRNPDGARTAANLIESIQKFRVAMEPTMSGKSNKSSRSDMSGDLVDLSDLLDPLNLGKEYIQMLQDGVIAAQYVEGWQMAETDAVLIAPAHTFLMMNRPATIQFWLDVGSTGWWERLFQPLTQPYVLSRAWMQREPGSLWTDADDVKANQETLARLVTGLLRRCRERVYLGLSDLGESGFEQRGPLLKAIWKMQMESSKGKEDG